MDLNEVKFVLGFLSCFIGLPLAVAVMYRLSMKCMDEHDRRRCRRISRV